MIDKLNFKQITFLQLNQQSRGTIYQIFKHIHLSSTESVRQMIT